MSEVGVGQESGQRLKEGASPLSFCRVFCGCAHGDISPALASLKGATVLGINPPVYDFAWFDLWSKPAGLLSILYNLRDSGNDVHLIDCLYEGRTRRMDFGRWKVERTLTGKPGPYRDIPRKYYRFGLNRADFRKRLASCPRPDVVLITSAMTYWYPGVFEAIKAAKEIFPGAFVILGGAYARLCPDHALQSGADFIQTEPLTFPYGTIALDLYEAPSYGVLITSWGCPMECGYCASKKLWPEFSQRKLEEVLFDLDAQASAGAVTDMAFYDDALLLNREKLFYPLCGYIRENYPYLGLHTPNGMHVAQLDAECCETLFRTGFRTIRLSLEGTDEFTSHVSSGKTGMRCYERAVEHLLRAGYGPRDIETYILAGLPGQKIEDIHKSISAVLRLGGRPKLAEFSPIPGTPLFDEAARLTPDIVKEPLLQNNTVYAPYVAKTISPGDMQELKDIANTKLQ